MYKKLLEPVKLGPWKLRNRIVMAPMTRCFADDQTGIIGDAVVDYYRRRASDGIGIIITEGILVSQRGKGTFNIPGLYTDGQVKGWEKVTKAVHEEGGTIIAQLWHVGRLTHHKVTGGFPPQGPSTIRATGKVHRYGEPFDTPEEMTVDDIKEVVQQYAKAAHNAKLAGFDGVEVHAAHGYLIDQFNAEVTNHRTDCYGGDQRQRLTFMKEVLQAVMHEAGSSRTIIRFSEIKDDLPDYKWENSVENIQLYLDLFKEMGLNILHPSTNRFDQFISNDQTLHELVRKYWTGSIIGVGDLNPHTADQAIEKGLIDLAAFGRPLLANPDFVYRLSSDAKLEIYNKNRHLAQLI